MPGELVGPEARLTELGHGGSPSGRIEVGEVPRRPRPSPAGLLGSQPDRQQLDRLSH